MSPDQDRQAIVDLLARARARTRTLRAVHACAGAIPVCAIAFAFFGRAVPPWIAIAGSAALIAVACGASLIWPRIQELALARAIERSNPESRNLILTSVELLRPGQPPISAITARVFHDAQRIAARVDLARTLPAARSAGALAVALAFSATSFFFRPGVTAADSRPVDPDAAVLESISIEITPPQYSGLPPINLRDPQRIDALAGSRVRVVATANASKVNLETLAGTSAMARGTGGFQADVVADADGYLAIVPVNAHGGEGPRRLIGLAVRADRSPLVRVTAPGRDQRVADGRRTVTLGVSAEDDLGLATLRVRYTRVSGSGENFSFKEGEVPLTLTKTTSQAWSGVAQWELAPFALEPGDMLIYRAVATDHRPGAPPAESDAFIIEITAAGTSAADGFAIDDREDRYAISQQMVIVKTERLLGRRAGMPAADFTSEALDLAAEQRQVRAEFVFMMGGELADAGVDLNSLNEEVEAAGEDDLAAGRLANQGRTDILRAIRSMSRAAAKLADGDATAALPLEKEALAFLQRAFSKSRYILRTLGARERLDLSRRLTGLLAALGRDSRPAVEAPPNPRLEALRRLLTDVASVSLDRTAAKDNAAQLSLLAQRALQTDSASAPVRDAAAKLITLADAIAGGRPTSAMKDDAVAAIAALVRLELPPGVDPSMPAGLAELAGALSDALRNGGRR